METKPQVVSLTPKEAIAFCEKGAIMLDIRDEYLQAFKYFSSVKSVNISFEELEEKLSSLSKNEKYIVADSTGIKNRDACIMMLEKGFTNVFNLAGGFVEWERDGLPFTHDINERLSGECACMLKQRQKGRKE